MESRKEKIVDLVKKCGMSIVENAESIVGDYKYGNYLSVTFCVDATEMPTIDVSREFIPDGIFDDLGKSLSSKHMTS